MARHIAENGLEKKPFVDETLDALRSMGIKTAVATATDRERARKYLTQIGVLISLTRSSAQIWWKMASRSRIYTCTPVVRSARCQKTVWP